jgi:hypothetical protein
MGVVGKAVLAKSTSMRLCRFLTALEAVAQRFAFLARQQISRQLAAAAAAGLAVVAAETTLVVEVALVMFRY